MGFAANTGCLQVWGGDRPRPYLFLAPSLRQRRSAAFTPLPRWTRLGLWEMPGPGKGADAEAA